MVRDGIERSLEMYLCLLKDQEARGVEREVLQGLADRVFQLIADLEKVKDMPPDEAHEEVTLDNGVTYTRKPIEPHEFEYGPPKKWKPKTGVTKGNHLVVKRAHPSWIPWHGRLA